MIFPLVGWNEQWKMETEENAVSTNDVNVVKRLS